MKRGFIKQTPSAKDLQTQIAQLAAAKVEIDAILIASDFDEMYAAINENDVIVVANFATISSSMNNFLERVEQLTKRGVTVESLEEPDVVVNEQTAPVFRVICKLSYELRKTRTIQGLDKARAQGKTLGRPVGTIRMSPKVTRVDEIRENTGMSIIAACQVAGCLPRTYYRLKKTKAQLLK